MADIINLIVAILALVIAYFTGTSIERNHYKKIHQREQQLKKLPTTSIGNRLVSSKNPIAKMELVTGCVVIGSDHFKDFVAGLKTIFGGRLKSYETLVDRARREAILRMRESAPNAKFIINTKLETTILNEHTQNEPAQVAVIAYGTAVTYEEQYTPKN